MFASVAIVHVLQHALAIAVREIDIDIGRFRTSFTEKPLKEQLHTNGVDRRDAEAVAHGRVGRRAASLTENALTSSEAHDVPHDEKEPGEIECADHRQFVRELGVVLGSARCVPSLVRPLLGKAREILEGTNAGRQRKRRQGGLELLKSEGAAFGNGEGGFDALLRTAPPLIHERRFLECPLRVGA